MGLGGETIYRETLILEGAEFQDLHGVTTNHRNAYKLTDDQNLFAAVAWVYKSELRLLNLFPSVVKIDDTSHTNNEKRPFMTFTAMTSSSFTAYSKDSYVRGFSNLYQQYDDTSDFEQQEDLMVRDEDSIVAEQLHAADVALHPSLPGTQREKLFAMLTELWSVAEGSSDAKMAQEK